MVTSYQKAQHGTKNLQARIDETAYNSMLGLMSAAGYDDVSSFVRDAVLIKCKDIANGLSSMYEDRHIAYSNTRR